jgi:hypothetical protein
MMLPPDHRLEHETTHAENYDTTREATTARLQLVTPVHR